MQLVVFPFNFSSRAAEYSVRSMLKMFPRDSQGHLSAQILQQRIYCKPSLGKGFSSLPLQNCRLMLSKNKLVTRNFKHTVENSTIYVLYVLQVSCCSAKDVSS